MTETRCYLTPEMAANFLGMSVQQVYKLRQAGELDGYRDERGWLLGLDSLEAARLRREVPEGYVSLYQLARDLRVGHRTLRENVPHIKHWGKTYVRPEDADAFMHGRDPPRCERCEILIDAESDGLCRLCEAEIQGRYAWYNPDNHHPAARRARLAWG